jgi:hypothetical protein
MKIFSEELVEKAVKELHIANLAQATIGDVLLVAQYLEKETGIPFIRMDQGSPGLAANQIGIEAEKAALDRGSRIAISGCRRSARVEKGGFPFCKSFLESGNLSARLCAYHRVGGGFIRLVHSLYAAYSGERQGIVH